MISQFSRSPLEKYQRIIANAYGGDTVLNGLLLTPEQMAVILQKLYSGKTSNLWLYFGITIHTEGIAMSTVTIRKSGNAQIVSLPKALLEQIGAGVGDTLSVELQDDTILLRREIPSRNPALQAELERMFDGVTPEMFQTPEDIEWMEMPSVGRELL